MTCRDCARHAASLRVLHERLAFSRRLGRIGAICDAFDITGAEARILLLLYEASGHLVSVDELIRYVPAATTPGELHAILSRMRQSKSVGRDTIEIGPEGVPAYRLTVPGMSRVLAALEPVEFQEVRG